MNMPPASDMLNKQRIRILLKLDLLGPHQTSILLSSSVIPRRCAMSLMSAK